MNPLTPRPGILEIDRYVGGRSAAPGVNRAIRLASNESALGPSPRAVAAYRGEAASLHRYPDGEATALRDAIGRHHGLDPERIVCGAGSDEIIGLLARCYAGPGEEVLYSEFGFAMYPISSRGAGATPVAAPERDFTADVDALLARAGGRTRLVFLANPNNPTGTYLTPLELRRLRAGLADDVLLVIDAAYAEFVDRNDYTPGHELVDAFDNVVVTRTFSKLHGLAALRLGWCYCAPDVADVLHRVRGPFNVASPAQAAGIEALADTAFADRAKVHNDTWRPWLAEALSALGLAVVPGVANFVLARFPAGTASAAAANAYLTERGILVRATAGYGLPDCLRITVGLEEENRAVVDALAAFLAAQA